MVDLIERSVNLSNRLVVISLDLKDLLGLGLFILEISNDPTPNPLDFLTLAFILAEIDIK
jgi:hypothetical protein